MKQKKYFFSQAVFFSSLLLVCLLAAGTASGQKDCDFNIIGTWKTATSDGANPTLYRFAEDGTVTVLSGSGSELREIATATYTLNTTKTPHTVSFKAIKGGEVFGEGADSIQIARYDDASFTSVKSGSTATKWVRVEPFRYFLVLAARRGTFYDDSGPAFPILIKSDGSKTEVEAAVGLYAEKGKPGFGTVPAASYNEFMKEPKSATDVMFRLEITAAQYERVMKILRMWERRVAESALLYPQKPMNNILLVKEAVESLNKCGEKIKMYNLDWGLEDDISELNKPSVVPFLYFRELKRMNESLHISDKKFNEPWHPVSLPAGR